MTNPNAARSFLRGEVAALEAFDYLVVGTSGKPLQLVEVTRLENLGLEVRIPGRPVTFPELTEEVRAALSERGFVSEGSDDRTEPWVHPVEDAAAAVELVQRVMSEVYGEKPDFDLDLTHGSHKAEHEAHQKLEVVRERIEKILFDWLGAKPEIDSDGDYQLPVKDVHVMVAPRIAPGGGLIVRVFAVTNVGVTVAPELGLFLARLNFGLVFGRFALDAEHSSVWVDETLLGDHFSDAELRFTVGAVASIADEWDDRLKQMFGGATYQEVLRKSTGHEVPPNKPGNAGYL
jgi:hypothetical protein